MTLDRSRPPEAGPARPLSIPRPDRHRLPNGLTVAAVRRPRLPEASLALVLPAGADSVGTQQAGLASLVAKVLPEGSSGKTSREMATMLDGLGVHLGVSVGYDSMILRLHTLSDQLEPALEALASVALAPDFLADEVDRCRAERLDAIRRSRDEPAEVAADVMAELLYGDHPYGRLTRGREGSVARLDRSDLVEFHARRFSPRVATLVACGDLPDGFNDLVTDCFGAWRGVDVDHGAPDTASAVASPGIVLVDRPGSGQSEIRMGAIGLERGDPHEPVARVTNAILGGLFNSRLNMNLREDKGWTYGARSTLSLRRSRGPVSLRAAVETAVTGAAVREMLREVQAMRESPPSEGEMRTATGALTRSLPLRFETNSQIAGTIAEQVIYGLPNDYWSTFSSRIGGVSRDSVMELADRMIDPDGLAILVVGDSDEVLPDLEELGSVTLRGVP
ncbi:MAG: insulinase family protein [marine benthic group bacterium]|nr:insulinase family protein [Gemmatimonadota bacterium]